MFIRFMVVAVLLGVVVATGCEARLRDNRTVEVVAANDLMVPISATSSERKINITAKSQGGPFSAYVYLTKHDDAVKDNMAAAPEDLFLGRALKVEEAEFSLDVPANEEVMIVLTTVNTPKVNVDLSISD